MGKPRDLANVVATGNILADGAVAPAELTGVNATAAELNILDGVTATAAELNLMDGVTATTAELNYVDGVTSNVQTQIDTKSPVASPTFTGTATAPTVNASTALQIGGVAVTATAAELNKMDGVTVSASDINSVTTKAPAASPTFTGTASLGDNVKLQFGAPDFEIFHDGSNTYLTEVGDSTGQVYLRANSIELLNNSNEKYINCITDGAVDLYHNNSKKFETTATGVTVTGTVAATSYTGDGSNLSGIGGGGTVDFTASGSLSNGDLVKLNSNGTVSVVAGGGAGSEATFASTNCSDNAATFDSNLNKVVVGYKDGLNNNYGTAVVGTISGSSISFGSPVVFESANTYGISLTFDSNSNKVVIAYSDGGNGHKATAIVGTVSGTSISFGSPVVFYSGLATHIATIFDNNSNKVVIAYRDYPSSEHGTAIVGTVSGTSISFGSAVVFESATTQDISGAFDSNSNKVVIAYADDGNSGYGTAIVGTVSGTSISFGSPAVFNSGSINYTSTVFDSNSNKIVIVYEDDDDGQRGEAVVGTVSGTSISFGAPVTFQGSGGKIGAYISAVFDSGSNQVIIAYEDDTASPKEVSVVVGTVDGTSLNFIPKIDLDTEGYEQVGMTFDSNSNMAVVVWSKQSNNYGTAATFKPTDVVEWIGFASADASNGATATINVVSSVNEGQSSLEVGSKYYLLDNGTLSTTVTSGREVGFATASTKLLITQGSIS